MVKYNEIKPKNVKMGVVQEEGRPEVKAVAKGQTKKPGLLSRTGNLFFGEEGFKGFTGHLIHEVIVPNMQNLLVDTLTDGIQRAVFGSVYYDSRSRRRGSNVRYIDDYRGRGRISSYDYDREYDRRPNRSRGNTRSDRVMRVEFTDYDDAKNVLTQMIDIVDAYQSVPVADYYELSDVPSKFTDHSWGWDNLDGARVVSTRDRKWIIELPPVIQL